MSDLFLAYTGFTVGIIIGWIKFMPKVKDKPNIYRTLNGIAILAMIVSYFPYRNFIESLSGKLVFLHLLVFITYCILLSLIIHFFLSLSKKKEHT
ncbi:MULTISPECIES: hypothetical protein [unclassified Moraxella]|uniref:hypothetical protein n=1 Tax=unclassified Moraxella TaxID=2685852 RepID=UPI003AF8CA65